MARIRSNPIVEGLSGRLSNIVFKTYKGVTIISKYPDMSRVKRTKAQKKQTTRFSEAVRYARSVSLNPELLKTYQKLARKEGRTIYHVALSDYMNDASKNLVGIQLAPLAKQKKPVRRRS